MTNPIDPPSYSAAGSSYPDIVGRLRAAGCVFAEDEAEALLATAGDPATLAEMVDRRVSGQPLEHILGWVEFAGLRLAVTPGVFVPRRRTEFLARQAAERVAPGATVVDLCCGSGAIGAAVLATLAALADRPDTAAASSLPAVPDAPFAAAGTRPCADAAGRAVHLVAADIDPVAVECARRNLAPHGAPVYLGDLFEALPDDLRGHIDVLVVNLPYVPTTEIRRLPPEARLYEPLVALDGGADGLDVLRRTAGAAREWLTPPVAAASAVDGRLTPSVVAASAVAGGLAPSGGVFSESDDCQGAAAAVSDRAPRLSVVGASVGGCLLVETSAEQATAAAAVMSASGLVPEILECEELGATVLVGRYSLPANGG